MGIEQTRWDWHQLLTRLSTAELATLLGLHYRQQGWQLGVSSIEDRPLALGPHGHELCLMRRGRLQLVWLWPAVAGVVEPPLVHQLTGRMLAQRAESAVLVSSLPIDAAARQVALGQQRLELVDGEALRGWLEALPEPQLRPLLEGVMRRQPPGVLAAPSPAPRWRRRLRQLAFGWAVALLLIWAAHWLARSGRPAPQATVPPAAAVRAVVVSPDRTLAGTQSTPTPRRASAIELPTVAPAPPPPGTVLRSRAEIRAWQRAHADELKALQESSRSV